MGERVLDATNFPTPQTELNDEIEGNKHQFDVFIALKYKTYCELALFIDDTILLIVIALDIATVHNFIRRLDQYAR